jgi:hypothetical protein
VDGPALEPDRSEVRLKLLEDKEMDPGGVSTIDDRSSSLPVALDPRWEGVAMVPIDRELVRLNLASELDAGLPGPDSEAPGPAASLCVVC